MKKENGSSGNISEFPVIGSTPEEWAGIKSEIADYYECLKNANFVIKEERMREIENAYSLIKEFVKGHCCEEDTTVEITHDEIDLRYWQIVIRTFEFLISGNEIEKLISAINGVDMISVCQTDNEEIKITLEFRDVAVAIL